MALGDSFRNFSFYMNLYFVRSSLQIFMFCISSLAQGLLFRVDVEENVAKIRA